MQRSFHWVYGALTAALLSACQTAPLVNYGSTKTLENPPPPISGGTLLVSRSRPLAIASDPDRDKIFIATLDQRPRVLHTLTLNANSEPGRAAEDARGNVHIVLRRAGEILSISPADGVEIGRRAVCATPRGIAYQASRDTLWISCASGELVQLPLATGATPVVTKIEPDLRDVAIVTRSGKEYLLVDTFRQARFHSYDITAGTLATHATASIPTAFGSRKFSTSTSGRSSSTSTVSVPTDYKAHVAWRMIPLKTTALVVHERSISTSVRVDDVSTTGYYGTRVGTCTGCSCSAVQTVLSSVSPGSSIFTQQSRVLGNAALAVDVAASSDGSRIAVVAPGNALVQIAPQVTEFANSNSISSPLWSLPDDCTPVMPWIPQPRGQATALAYTSDDRLVVQTREPAALFFPGDNYTLTLSEESRRDTGHDVFHSNPGTFITCASCHPEGGDDGHTWTFNSREVFRTPSLRGGLLKTAPFHWRGDLQTMHSLTQLVLTERMAGPSLDESQTKALEQWLDHVPLLRPPTPVDTAAVERGRALYHRTDVGCATCHGSDGMSVVSNNMNVGTGDWLQVPALGNLYYRAPYMHSGCAATLRDRLTQPLCGGSQHGNMTNLAPADLTDLEAFLNTL